MTLFDRHLDSTTLGDAALGGVATPRNAEHLASCTRCRRECDRLRGLLAEARDRADEAVDAAFSPVDLERQRHTILQRIAKTGGVARVLRFPHGPDRLQPAPRSERRWLVAAAVAGLLIGVAAGQLPRLVSPSAPPAMARAVTAVAPAPSDDRRLDDTLLSEVDAALDRLTRPEMEALDALTPVHYETR